MKLSSCPKNHGSLKGEEPLVDASVPLREETIPMSEDHVAILKRMACSILRKRCGGWKKAVYYGSCSYIFFVLIYTNHADPGAWGGSPRSSSSAVH